MRFPESLPWEQRPITAGERDNVQGSMKHVLIIGGGISGLATAYYLQQAARAARVALKWTLIEGTTRVGGKVVTEKMEGFVIEGGPDSFLRQKPSAMRLAQQLNLDDALMGTNGARAGTAVLNGGRLVPLPEGLALLVPTRLLPFVTSPLFSWTSKLRMGLDLVLPPRKGDSDESVADFVRRRLGQEAVDKLAEPLLSGIHMSEPERQSLLATFPQFRELERNHGSLIRGMLAQRHIARGSDARPAPDRPASPFLTLREGMGQLIGALQEALNGEILLSTSATHIERVTSGYRVLTTRGSFDGDALVLATPATASSAMLSELAPGLCKELSRIRYLSTATISLGYRAADLPPDCSGFGFVLPRTEGRRIRACTWSSAKFQHRAPADHVLLRCYVGGPGHEEDATLDDAALLQLVRQELQATIGLTAEPLVSRIFRWPLASPQYDVGHLDRVARINEWLGQLPGLFLTGIAYGGVGLPDCIRQGEEAAQQVLAYFLRRAPLEVGCGRSFSA
jgi:protoporphyrinogen/coproporphyrinogen III oxidase